MSNKSILVERRDKTIYRDGDKLIKLFDESYSKSNILNEALNQARALETGLNIPKIHEITVIGGKSAIVMDYIEGETIEQLLRKYPEKEEEFLAVFVKTQLEIHAKKHLLLTKFADKLRMKILQSELSASTRYDLSMRLDGMPRHTHVCHGDYNCSNVVIDKSGTPYVLDWSHASQGNATADGTKTYLLLLWGGYERFARAYLEQYCTSVGVTEQYFREWMPLIAAAQLVRTHDPVKKKILMDWIEEGNY